MRLTHDLIRKKSEHNDGVLGDLQEISLHQLELEKIEAIGDCKKLRILYLQNRRYELGYSVGGGAGGESDPYDDPYGDPYDETAAGAAPAPVASADPYYEDPYDDPSL